MLAYRTCLLIMFWSTTAVSENIKKTQFHKEWCTLGLMFTHHRHGQDKTVLSCFVGGVNRIDDKSRLFWVVFNILETEQSCLRCKRVCKQVLVGNWKLGWDETKLFTPHFETVQNSFEMFYRDSFDLSPVLFSPPTWTRHSKQDGHVLSMPVMWSRHKVTRTTWNKNWNKILFYFTRTLTTMFYCSFI